MVTFHWVFCLLCWEWDSLCLVEKSALLNGHHGPRLYSMPMALSCQHSCLAGWKLQLLAWKNSGVFPHPSDGEAVDTRSSNAFPQLWQFPPFCLPKNGALTSSAWPGSCTWWTLLGLYLFLKSSVSLAASIASCNKADFFLGKLRQMMGCKPRMKSLITREVALSQFSDHSSFSSTSNVFGRTTSQSSDRQHPSSRELSEGGGSKGLPIEQTFEA